MAATMDHRHRRVRKSDTGLEPVEFGEWVKRTRLSQGLKQGDVAERGGMRQNTIGEIERGWRDARLPSVYAFECIARGLGVELGYVLHKAGYAVGANDVNLARLERVEGVMTVLDEREREIRMGLAEAVELLRGEGLLGSGAGVAATRALASFDLVVERLHEERQRRKADT